MPYYLTNQLLAVGDNFKMIGSEMHHIRVNRQLALGNYISVQDPKPKRFLCVITEIFNDHILLKVDQVVATINIKDRKLSLYVGFAREKALNFILQKSTELNVQEIVLFKSTYSQPIPKEATLHQKVNRWQKIISEAAKQSNRLDLPKLTVLNSLITAKERACTNKELIYVFDKEGKKLSHQSLISLKPSALFIGPEGGFSVEELKLISIDKNCIFKLGDLNLRVETAAITALSLLKLAN
ncbi:MAG: 16S rRNA (uracil(1498)-N(3))-methyltransferase [SAR324 cluster bacterium]|nr:16S rRNA (uracil(1498)-N(3))-methyltransferase [SAR324 cluster bacterium]